MKRLPFLLSGSSATVILLCGLIALPSSLRAQAVTTLGQEAAITAPPAVIDAVKKEWPDATIDHAYPAPNPVARYPRMIWYARLSMKTNGEKKAADALVTDSGVILEIKAGLRTVDALPKTVVDAVAAAVPGCRIFATEGESVLRVDKTMKPLPQPTARYVVYVQGPETFLRLSVSTDGKTVKTDWETSPEAAKTIRDTVPNIRNLRANGDKGWRAIGTEGRPAAEVYSFVMNSGELQMKLDRHYDSKDIAAFPEPVRKAYEEVSQQQTPNSMRPSVTCRERCIDQKGAPIAPPAVTYEVTGGNMRTTYTATGAIVQKEQSFEQAGLFPPLPDAVREVATKLLPEWKIDQGMRQEKVLNERLEPLATPDIYYDVVVTKGQGTDSRRKAIYLTEAGAVRAIYDTDLGEDELPKAVAEAVALKGEGAGGVSCWETRIDKDMRQLDPPRIRYYLYTTGDNGVNAHYIFDDAGKIVEDEAEQ